MSQPMRSLLKCSQCGAMLPPGKSVCPKDGARAVADNPFVDEATVRRDSSSPPSSGKGLAVVAAVTPAPAQPVHEDEDEDDDRSASKRAWEETVSRDVMVGKQLGDFIVKRRIGAGGMGIVYEGEHPIIGRKVAIKILRPEFSDGGNARDLIAEARAASSIRHRGIIDIFGFGTIPHVGQYMVMEFLEGQPLDEVISQRAPMLEAEVINLLDELLAALSAAHAKGVIHRDLKPGNIFVVKDSSGAESVKVLDFGLAKRSTAPNGTSPQTRASMIVGTPEYMAPEQATGQAVGPHTDLYSVGVIAFEMLTRRLPFEGASPMAIAIQHVQAKAPAPSSFVEVYPALDELVLRLLSKTAAARPATAEAARRELKAIARQLADGATRLEPAPRSERLATEQEIPIVVTRPSGGNSEATHVSKSRPALAPGKGSKSRPALASETSREQVVLHVVSSPPNTERVATVRPSRAPRFAAGAVVLLALGALGFWALNRGEPSAPVAPPMNEVPSTARSEPVQPPPPPVQEVKPAAPPAVEPPVEPTPPVAETPKPPTATPSASTLAQQTPGSQKKPGGTGLARIKNNGPPGTLRLMPVAWADIYVNGQLKGHLPQDNELDLPPGRYQLELRKPGFKTYRAAVSIKSDETTEHLVKWVKADAPDEGP
jgi:serine/threonine protein kinase